MADDEGVGAPTDAGEGDEALDGGFRLRAVTILFGAVMVVIVLGVAAFIILPTLGRTSHRPSPVICMSNLHQISLAMKMYHQDTGGYPRDLNECPIPAGENWYGPDQSKTRPGSGLAALYPDYVQNVRVYNCYRNDTQTLGTEGKDFDYQSYDGEDPAAGPGGNMMAGDGRLYADGQHFAPAARLRYARVWKVHWRGNTARPDPTEPRQLIWRNPPPDTVLTWCPYHRRDWKAAQVRPDDGDLIVYVDGSTRTVKSLNESGHGSRAPE